MSPKVRVHVLPFSRDLRAPGDIASLEQARADQALEAEWRRRVADNVLQRQATKFITTEGGSLEYRSPRAA